MIISITILSLILGVIFGAIRLASNSWETGEKRVEKIQRERISFDLISEDIKSILPFHDFICSRGKGCNSQKAYFFIGEERFIKFIASNPGFKLSKDRYRVVSYYLESDPNSQNYIIMMKEEKWLFPDFFKIDDSWCMDCEDMEFECSTYIYPIYKDIKDLTFKYWGVKEKGREPEEHETWNSCEEVGTCSSSEIVQSLPLKVIVTIVSAASSDDKTDEDKTTVLEVPIMAMMDN